MAGRIHGNQHDVPDVIIGWRRATWTAFGRMIASFDGWWFRMTFGDDDVPAQTAQPDNCQPL